MKISVASGKGGTGKTLVATNMAATLASLDELGVTIADCDVEEPNSHLFFPKKTIIERKDCQVTVPVIDEGRCSHCGKCSDVCAYHALAVLKKDVLLFAELCHGCGACAIVCPENAISDGSRTIGEIIRARSNGLEMVWGELATGEARSTPLIRAVKDEAENKMVIVDCPPGTSCALVESVRGTDFCLLVTEPTPFGLYDLKIAVKVLAKMAIPHGVLVNKCGTGDERVYSYLKEKNIPLLMEIPLDRRIAEIYSRGMLFAEEMAEWKAQFKDLARKIENMVEEMIQSNRSQ
ncbi:MAG TPA: ATP-binding protein [Methanothrix sp.]|nr:ATP-binding protein [Methanothrix sp.]